MARAGKARLQAGLPLGGATRDSDCETALGCVSLMILCHCICGKQSNESRQSFEMVPHQFVAASPSWPVTLSKRSNDSGLLNFVKGKFWELKGLLFSVRFYIHAGLYPALYKCVLQTGIAGKPGAPATAWVSSTGPRIVSLS